MLQSKLSRKVLDYRHYWKTMGACPMSIHLYRNGIKYIKTAYGCPIHYFKKCD